MSDLPEPLVPADLDVRHADWFALHFKRLKRSEFWMQATLEVKGASLDLWTEAFENVPAGSLPDSDIALARAVGFSARELGEWRRIRDDVMRPWILCSDGRWYHPTLCEIAADAAERVPKKRQPMSAAERMRQARARKKMAAAVTEVVAPAALTATPLQSVTDVPPIGQDRTEQNRTEDSAAAESPTALILDANGPKVDWRWAQETWNTLAREASLTVIIQMNEKRKSAAKARLKEHGREAWERALSNVGCSRFLRGLGDSGRNWKASFDWFVASANFIKVLEGTYDRSYQGGGHDDDANGAGPSGGRKQRPDVGGDFRDAAMASVLKGG